MQARQKAALKDFSRQRSLPRPWVAAQGISSHWIRHTTLTWVERNFGYAVARAYAGHTDGSDTGATATYVRASLAEVAAALAALTGEPHTLATTEGW